MAGTDAGARGFLQAIRAALGGDPDADAAVTFEGEGALRSCLPVTDLAAGSVAAACLAAAEYRAASGGPPPAVRVDRRLASLWFRASVRPGWDAPPAWDSLAGDYATVDGWIKLHTNAPHHRAAALRALGLGPEVTREAVAEAVAGWRAEALEAAVVGQGGCAAEMRGLEAWRAHPQGAAVRAAPLVLLDRGEDGPALPPMADGARPLAGLRVLDLTRILAGPVATRFLAGLGAEVLRIDPPDWEEPSLEPEVTLGKRCARLDLRTEPGRARFLALLSGADMILHGYRPGALEGLGLGPEVRAAARPGLVDVSLCAYGFSGPWAGRRGFDSLVQLSSGIAALEMEAAGLERPGALPVQALDHAAGYILAAAALRGLTARRTDGRGMRARTSLARCAALLTEGGAGPVRGDLGAAEAADHAPAPERTVWGEALRLRPPALIEGAPLAWDRPAGPLGTSPAAWL